VEVKEGEGAEAELGDWPVKFLMSTAGSATWSLLADFDAVGERAAEETVGMLRFRLRLA